MAKTFATAENSSGTDGLCNNVVKILSRQGIGVRLWEHDETSFLRLISQPGARQTGQKNLSKVMNTYKTLLMLKCDVDVTSEYNEAFFSRAVYYFTPTQLQEFSLLGLPMYLVGTEQ